MNKTKIEWVKNPDGSQGYTWNPITGCLNHDNGLCKGGGFPCYAYKLASTRLKQRYLADTNTAVDINDLPVNVMQRQVKAEIDPFYPRFWEERLDELKPKKGRHLFPMRKPRGIFVCDMGDLFGTGVPEEWTHKVLNALDQDFLSGDRFYLLTKQPQRLPKFSPFPENCWVGVTACNDDMFWRALNCLRMIRAKIKYLSLEPFLYPIRPIYELKGIIDWLIIGAQTKPYKPPKIEWVREIVEAADKAGIKVFLKDNLEPIIPQDRPFRRFLGGLLGELRQEMPE